ncbi:MAG: PRC-barrel domain-containing protein [Candidatus Pacearchaeota archaeon]
MVRIKLLTSFIFIVLFLNNVIAITGNSSNYSVNMFGNSVSTGNANSNNYIATFLSENSGTNNNALSNSFTGNIGFFETPYFTTVKINSYSVSPKSVVIGNTVSLSISASNYESIWVEIVSPDSQEQRLNLDNGQTLNYLPVPSIIGRYNVTFYANSSNGAIASVIDYFDLVGAQVSTTGGSSGSSGGSGGGSGVTQSCNYNWDCTPWSLCANGLQTRSCVNIGTCTGQESKPIESMSCNQALFDILIDLENLQLIDDNKIRFNVNLEEQFGIEELDVHLKYSIIDENNFEVFSQIETRAVKGNLEIGKEIILNLEEGNYILRVDVLYGNLQRAFAEQSFVIDKSSNAITGLALIDYMDSRRITFSVLLLVISSIILLASYYYSLNLSKKVDNSNSLNGIIGLDVYTNSGLKIGKVYDLVINDNTIYGLAVLVDKGVPVNHSKVMIRYQYVENVNDVVLVNSSILEHNPHESA